jgi:hypothetical protein
MQKHYSQRYSFGFPGLLDGIGPVQSRALLNAALDSANRWTIGIPATVDANATYSVSVTGGNIPSSLGSILAEFETGAAPSQATLGSGLLAAIQATDIMQFFNAVLQGNTITLEALRSGIGYTITSPSNATTTNDLVVTEAAIAANSSNIPMGRFVVQLLSASETKMARLPASNTGIRVMGVTGLVSDQERNAIGEAARYEYYPNQAMDVVHRTANGIWVECDSGSLKSSEVVYIDCNTEGKLGRLTTVATNNLALPAGVALVDDATIDLNDVPIVLVGVTLP